MGLCEPQNVWLTTGVLESTAQTAFVQSTQTSQLLQRLFSCETSLGLDVKRGRLIRCQSVCLFYRTIKAKTKIILTHSVFIGNERFSMDKGKYSREIMTVGAI